MLDLVAARRLMVDNQLRTYDVTDKSVLAAMMAVPREDFLPDDRRELAYLDRHQPIGPGRVLLSPMLVARLIQLAEPAATDRTLCVGSGTGYVASVMARLTADVTALEAAPEWVATANAAFARLGTAHARAVAGPLAEGVGASAPYDVIVVEGAFAAAPATLLAQLAEGGRLVGVLGHSQPGRAMLYRRSGEATSGRHAFDAAAPLLAGFGAQEAFRFAP